jgi:hypothetical protein
MGTSGRTQLNETQWLCVFYVFVSAQTDTFNLV